MRSGLVYEEHRPYASLRSHVACYWTLIGAEVAAHCVLPGGCMDLVFGLSSASDPRAMLVGTMSAAVVAPAAVSAHFLGVRFRPGEAFAFVGVSALESKDQMIPLTDVLGALGEALLDELASAPNTSARIAALDRRLATLRERARSPDSRVREAVARIMCAPAEAGVAELARYIGVGERQLERIFAERVGLGPKAFARVARFQALLRRVGDTEVSVPWAALALELGYSDQAHMAREVKRLSGMTPTELASTTSDAFNPSFGSRRSRPERTGGPQGCASTNLRPGLRHGGRSYQG
jgi:AraC-like DNA-binding protein